MKETLTATTVVEDISPLETRLLVAADRVVNDDDDAVEEVGGGEAAFAEVRLCVLVGCGFDFNSPSGIISSFSFVEQLIYVYERYKNKF